MGTLKVKGNWNQQKGKLKMQFSNLAEEEIYNVEEGLLMSLDDSRKPKKKPKTRNEREW